jgi:hypothetical protein
MNKYFLLSISISFFSICTPRAHRLKKGPAMPKLHLNYVMHQSSIRYSTYTFGPPPSSKAVKQENKAFFEKMPEET